MEFVGICTNDVQTNENFQKLNSIIIISLFIPNRPKKEKYINKDVHKYFQNKNNINVTT